MARPAHNVTSRALTLAAPPPVVAQKRGSHASRRCGRAGPSISINPPHSPTLHRVLKGTFRLLAIAHTGQPAIHRRLALRLCPLARSITRCGHGARRPMGPSLSRSAEGFGARPAVFRRRRGCHSAPFVPGLAVG